MFFIIFLITIFLHVYSDFYAQGWLSQAKCKEWWRKQEDASYIVKDASPQRRAIYPLYELDYWGMLIAHSAHWAFYILLPSLVYGFFNASNIDFFGFAGTIVFVCNVFVHACIDNWKANAKLINLLEDQALHIIQIIVTIIIMFSSI